jgi:fibronectin type 3 domain-containing protein
MRRISVLVALAGLGSVVWSPSVALAQLCTVNVPNVDGEWATAPYLMPINPISVTLLHDGHVLIVAGSENDASNNSAGSESYRTAIWDPMGTTQSSVAVRNINYDVFCSGTAVLRDGRPLIVGGTNDYSFTGESRATIYDPVAATFAQTQSMADGRWYATATALGDGRVMTFSGLALSGATNNTVEIYDPSSPDGGWGTPRTAPFTPPLYPRMSLLPNGTVFFTGQGGSTQTAQSWIFNPLVSRPTWTASAATTMDRHYGSEVILPLLPPDYRPRVMSFGGGDPATASTEIIDLSAATPQWAAGPNMSSGRIEMNATILPSGQVLLEGGSLNNESPNPAGKKADIYNPTSNTMSSGGTAAYSRLYHSVALLLPDATVASLGSNPGNRGSYEPSIEIYTPPYLFDANNQRITTGRPSITSAPSVIGYGAPFSVSYTSNSPVSSAVLVRPGSATHAFDMDQRLIGLCGPAPQPPCGGSAGTLNLTSPPNGNIAPAGYYMLFLLDSAGVPSKAVFLQLSSFAAAPPSGVGIPSPASDMTIAAGGSVFFSTDPVPGAAKYSWVFPGGSPSTSTAQIPGFVSFATAGKYVASLTVVDGSGNSDPDPPTRTITVTPATPGFDLTVTPAVQSVGPGGGAAFTVTVSPLTGFTETVNLSVTSESGFPSGITSGGFSPASISGGSGSSTLTMSTTTSTNPYALSLTVIATSASGAVRHTASTTLVVDLLPPSGSPSANPGNAQVALSWPAAIGATSYHIKRGSVSGGPYVTVGCSATTSFTDTGLSNGSTYFYVVSSAFTAGNNAGGESANSGEVAATPQGAPPPPTPTGLTAAAGNAQVLLSWNASTGATSYNVKRGTVSGGPYTVVGTPSTPSFTDTGVSNGTTYFYVVSAVNANGESANSGEVTATPHGSPPATPTGLSAAAGNAQVSLSWSASTGATSYNVKRSTVTGGPYTVVGTPTSPSFTDTSVSNGTTYFYVVSAVNANGESANSGEVTATPHGSPPPTPTGLAALAGNAQVSLSWNASTGATSYNVKRSTVSGGPYTVVGTATSPSFTDTSASNGTTYFYVVSAVNANGESANSTQVSATPSATPPAPPTNLGASSGKPKGGVTLTWTQSTSPGLTQNRIYRRVSTGTYPATPTATIAPATSFVDTGLTSRTTYCYQVTAVNGTGESAKSAEACAAAK